MFMDSLDNMHKHHNKPVEVSLRGQVVVMVEETAATTIRAMATNGLIPEVDQAPQEEQVMEATAQEEQDHPVDQHHSQDITLQLQTRASTYGPLILI